MGDEKSELIESQETQSAGELFEPRITEGMQETRPTIEGQKAAEEAIKQIHSRSYSGRHPEMGRMIKCQFCGRRHRASEIHEQKFATGRYDLRDPKPLLIAGQTPETRSVFTGQMPFKRHHLNWRQNVFVQLVRTFVPDEYTEKELKNAKSKARKILAEKYGRHGFLPPIWQAKRKINGPDFIPQKLS